MQKIATELQEEIYKKFKCGMKKCDLAVLYNLTWTRIDQIVKRVDKMHTNPNIKEKLWMAYPDVNRNIVSGAVNAIIHACQQYHYDTYHIAMYMDYIEFFTIIDGIDFEELLYIKSMGIVKARFLKRALNDYKKGVLCDDSKRENDTVS